MKVLEFTGFKPYKGSRFVANGVLPFMPLYEYECQACGGYLETLQKMSDPVLTDCPACGKPALKKLISAAGFRLKGAGWYETDFKNAGKKNLHESGKGESKPEVKSDAKADSKPDSKPETKTETAKPTKPETVKPAAKPSKTE